MKNKICSVIFAIAVFFFIISFSIGLPIYFRPFYYAHIDAMNLVERSGFTKAEIKEAYNEMLDYLTLPCKEFCTGVMRFSESGASHFADCKLLFNINAAVLVFSAIIVIAMLVLYKHGKIKKPELFGRSAEFWSAVSAIVFPIVLGGLASVNFNKAFTVFHKIFFPGKENWLFDPFQDQIIKVLPETFFMNCAILISVSVLIISFSIIVKEVIIFKLKKLKHKNG